MRYFFFDAGSNSRYDTMIDIQKQHEVTIDTHDITKVSGLRFVYILVVCV